MIIFAGGLQVGAPLEFGRNVTATGVPAQLPPHPEVKTGTRKSAISGNEVMAQETEETRKLTNSQLQRLVLLEQLNVARLQQKYFTAKLKDRTLPAPAFVHENDRTFEILQ